MNREIKFRAWSVSQNEMLPNVGFHPHMMMDLSGDDEYYKDNIEGRYLINPKFDNFKLMQFTGLKDRKGTEIYEGDLFKINGYTKEIAWDEYHSCFGTKDIELKHLGGIDAINGEVVGDIYRSIDILKF